MCDCKILFDAPNRLFKFPRPLLGLSTTDGRSGRMDRNGYTHVSVWIHAF